jgi:hypothetical protein
MTALRLERRLRLFLMTLSAFILVASMVELGLADHMENAVQLIPFGLAGLGLVAVGVALWWPGRVTLISLRLVMGLVGLGSVFGIFEHVEHNLAFAHEIRPTANSGQLLLEALSGANPLLAPGILALAALLALAATYYHPLLGQRAGE